jgi:hypothetical protein
MATWEFDGQSFKFDDFKLNFEENDIVCIRDAISLLQKGESLKRIHMLPQLELLSSTIDNYKKNFLDKYPGYFILSNSQRISSENWEDTFKICSFLIGEFYPQDKKGSIIREVKYKGTAIGEGETSRYSDSNQGGNMHTDGAQSPFPVPDYFNLLCMRKAAKGGAFRMLSVEKIYSHFQMNFPKALEQLTQPFHFDRRGDNEDFESNTTPKSVFFSSSQGISMTYLRKYIDSGHSQLDVPPLTEEQVNALDILDKILDDPFFWIEGYLEEGEMLFVNNKKIVHGRSAFEDSFLHKRLLLRIWLTQR